MTTTRPEPDATSGSLAPADPAADAASARSRPGRRRAVFLGAGVLLAGVLAIVLVSGLVTPSSPTSTSTADLAPGIGAASAQLLQLDVLASRGAPAAPNFHLVDQYGASTSLSQFRGKVVIWSLNDDQCTDLCALFAQDVVAADRDLGPAAKDVVFLSVNANPFYPSPAALRAWSVQNDVEPLPNWVYVTGTPTQLTRTWNAYHVTVELDRQNRTVVHDAVVEFIDPAGRMRGIGSFSQGSISTAYYAHAMAQMADDLLPAREQVRVGGTDVDSSTTAGATIGSRAPRFTLPALGSGRAAPLARYGGKPLVLNFWASTCSLCVQEMPALQRVDTDFGGKVNFVGVDVADPRQAAASFARAAGVRYPLLADHDGSVAADYRVDALPVTFIIGRGGTILARHEGALTHDELVAILDMDFPNLPQVGD